MRDHPSSTEVQYQRILMGRRLDLHVASRDNNPILKELRHNYL